MADLGREAARGTAVTLVAQSGRFVLQIGSLIVLARLLSPEAFGLVAMVTSLIGIAELIRDFGLSSAAIQAKHLSHEERTNLFWINVGIGTVCAILAVVFAPLIADLYHEQRVYSIVLALSGMLVVSGITTQYRADLSRNLRFRALAAVDLSAQTLGVAVAIIAAALGADYWAIVAQQITFVVVTCTLSVVFSRWRPGLPKPTHLGPPVRPLRHQRPRYSNARLRDEQYRQRDPRRGLGGRAAGHLQPRVPVADGADQPDQRSDEPGDPADPFAGAR